MPLLALLFFLIFSVMSCKLATDNSDLSVIRGERELGMRYVVKIKVTRKSKKPEGNQEVSTTCSAVFVSSSVALTAAHCVKGEDVKVFYKKASTKAFYQHPDYTGWDARGDYIPFDIAIVNFAEPVFEGEVARLNHRSGEVGQKIRMAGYGFTKLSIEDNFCYIPSSTRTISGVQHCIISHVTIDESKNRYNFETIASVEAQQLIQCQSNWDQFQSLLSKEERNWVVELCPDRPRYTIQDASKAGELHSGTNKIASNTNGVLRFVGDTHLSAEGENTIFYQGDSGGGIFIVKQDNTDPKLVAIISAHSVETATKENIEFKGWVADLYYEPTRNWILEVTKDNDLDFPNYLSDLKVKDLEDVANENESGSLIKRKCFCESHQQESVVPNEDGLPNIYYYCVMWHEGKKTYASYKVRDTVKPGESFTDCSKDCTDLKWKHRDECIYK